MMNPQVTNIYGPPGTGKTTQCIRTVQQWLTEGVDPSRIGYFAFTTNAAQEAKGRAVQQTDATESELEWFKTLHGAAFRLAGVRRDQVVQNDDVAAFARTTGTPYNQYLGELDDLYEPAVKEGNLLLSIWQFGLNSLKTDMDEAWEIAPDSITERCDRNNYRSFIRKYEEWKRQEKKVDFTDMLLRALDCRDTTGCSHIVIDEAQDLTPLQWAVARLVGEDASVIVRAGDDDQSIFSWLGVRSKDYIDIEGEQKVLTQSYRVPKRVHLEAQRIISQNRNRVAKDYNPRDFEGSFTRQGGISLPQPPEGETAFILCRNKRHLNEYGEELMAAGIPFASNRFKSPLTDEKVKAGLIALCRWNDRGEVSTGDVSAILDMVANGPLRYEIKRGAKQSAWREAKARPFSKTTDIGLTPEALRIARKDPVGLVGGKAAHHKMLRRLLNSEGPEGLQKTPSLFISTVHGAKGMEADHVYISQDALRSCQEGVAENPEEENRLRYIAVTRAKQSVSLLPERAEGGWAI